MLLRFDELQVTPTNHLARRVPRHLHGEGVHEGDSPLLVDFHHQKLNAVEQLAPAAFVGQHLTRQTEAARMRSSDRSQLMAATISRKAKVWGLGRWNHPISAGMIVRRPEGIDHQADTEKASLPALAATDHADGAVEEDQQKPRQDEITNDPQRVRSAGNVRDLLAPRAGSKCRE